MGHVEARSQAARGACGSAAVVCSIVVGGLAAPDGEARGADVLSTGGGKVPRGNRSMIDL
jgi:hypothetical protein